MVPLWIRRAALRLRQPHNTSLVGWIEEKRPGQNYGRGTEGSTIRYDRGSVNGAGPYFTFSAPLKDESGRTLANLPCQRPPRGRLVAVNANGRDRVGAPAFDKKPCRRQTTHGQKTK